MVAGSFMPPFYQARAQGLSRCIDEEPYHSESSQRESENKFLDRMRARRRDSNAFTTVYDKERAIGRKSDSGKVSVKLRLCLIVRTKHDRIKHDRTFSLS